MKRVLSLVLALALVLGSIPAGFAADTQTAGEILKGYGVLSGDANGNLNETQTIDRATMYTVLIKLLGKDAEAKAYTVPSTFSDDNNSWAANYIAFAEKEGLTKGVGNGLFSPEGKVTLQQMATIMLRALGYEADYNTAIADATAQGLLKSVVETENNGIVVKSDVYTSMLNTLNAPVKDSTTLLGNALKIVGFVPANAGPVAVSTIAATSAKTIKVTFASAVADTTKAVFTVKRGSTAATVTTTWNEAKTEATLTSAANFAEATYSVNVAYDAKDLSAKDVAFTQQKIAKIEFTSPSVAVTTGASPAGYVTYKVYDQYNNDITTSSMANTLNYSVGVGNAVTLKNGTMTIAGTPTSLNTLQSLSVVLYDSNGVTATKALPISTAVGTLQSFELGSVENVKLVEGDTTTVFYIPYTATDLAGNPTKDYDLVIGGMIDADTLTAGTQLVASLSTNISAEIVKDPANSKMAAVAVKYKGTSTNFMDMPLTITAMTATGKSSSVSTTLVKAKAVESIVLMAPAETVATTETPEIPFEAYDKNGDRIYSYTYINSTTITPTGFTIVEKADGNAKFVMTAAATKGPVTLTANVVKSGKVSNILTINVQDAVYPASIAFVQSGIVTAMEDLAAQAIEVEDDVVVYDQYGREMDFDDIGLDAVGNNTGYHINMTASTTDITVGTAAIVANADTTVTAANAAGGYATVSFELVQDLATDKVIDTASVGISVVKTTDIKSYTINTASTALYTADEQPSVVGSGTVTDQEAEYSFTAKVYGATQAGTKVKLAGNPVIAAALTNTTDFVINTAITTASAYNAALVTAKKLDNNRTEATTDLIVTVAHNNVVKPLKVEAIKSSTKAPVATAIALEGADDDGIYDVTGGVATIQAGVAHAGLALTMYDSTETDASYVVGFEVTDSYDTNGMDLATLQIAKITNAAGTAYSGATLTGKLTGLSFNTDHELVYVTAGNTLVAGDKISITAVTNNGLSATLVIVVK